MAQEDAQKRFKEADAHYRAGRYQEAYQLLEALNAEFPGERNIMYPLAFSSVATGRLDQARALQQELAERFEDKRAAKLGDSIAQALRAATPPTVKIPTPSPRQSEPPAAPSMPGTGLEAFEPINPYETSAPSQTSAPADLMGLGGVPGQQDAMGGFLLDDVGETSSASRKVVANVQEDDTLVLKIALGVGILFVTLIMHSVFGYFATPEAYADTPFLEEDIQMIIETYQQLSSWTFNFLTSTLLVLTYPIPLYFVLRMLDKLPYDLFWKDYFSVYGYSLILMLTSFLCCIGTSIGLWIIKQKYETGFAGVILFLTLSFAYWVVFAIIWYALILFTSALGI